MAKRLERKEETRIVAGVLAGLADYFDQDPRLFRILAVAFLIFTGLFPGLLIYLVSWIIMPLRKNALVDYEL